VLKWKNVDGMGKNKILSSSYFWVAFVPLCANFFKEVNNISITIMGHVYKFYIDVPFSWHLFYFSALLVACAKTIYSFYCPEIIRLYSTFNDFTEQGKGKWSIITYFIDSLSKTNIEEKKIILNNFIEQFCEPISASNLDEALLKNNIIMINDKVGDAFWFVREEYQTKNPIWLHLCFICYLLGIVLLLFVIYTNTKLVWLSFKNVMKL
jgi:hypothetical protein